MLRLGLAMMNFGLCGLILAFFASMVDGILLIPGLLFGGVIGAYIGDKLITMLK